MHKKLLALAVAGALAPAAAMAQSTVEIYGRANLGIDSWEAKGATAAGADRDRRFRIYDGSSRLGFRVNESLGGGMRAFVVLETGVNIDTGNANGQSGEVNTSAGTWASRDSYVGIGGGWGDVRFGRQSVWWSNGVIAQTGANYINTAADGLINDPGLVAIPSARTSNVVSYNSPTIGGFNASLSYSPGSEAVAGGVDPDGKLLGVTGRFTTGALRAQIDWARNSVQTVTPAAQAENTGLKIGVGWAYAPGSQLSFIWGRLWNDNIVVPAGAPAGLVTAGDDVEQDFFMVNWEHMMGPWQLLAQFYKSLELEGNSGGGSDTGATGFTVAAKYFLSKRTGVYASYSQAKNDARSWADISGGGISSGGAAGIPASAAGADPKIFALGIMHNF